MATSNHPTRPLLACEFGTDRIVAARANSSRTAIEAQSLRRLVGGAIVPGFMEANIRDRGAVLQAVQDALSPVSGGAGDVIAVLPDGAVRVMLLDFDSLPEKPEEIDAVLRFRLRKSLPFDVDASALSFDAARRGSQVRVLVAVTPHPVLEEYESVLRECGYAPGWVLPSTLGALGLVDASQPTMLVKMDPASISVAIVHEGMIALLRTLEHIPGTSVAELAESIHPSIVYFEDNHGSRLQRVLVTGSAAPAGTAQSLQAEMGVSSSELSMQSGDSGDPTPRGALTAVAGALLA